MNIKERIQTVLQKLKLLDKAKANNLSDEEWKQLVDTYQKSINQLSKKIWPLTWLHKPPILQLR